MQLGTIINNGVQQFSYDDANNMRCVGCNTSKPVTFDYDTDNLRVKRKRQNGLFTYTMYARDGNLVMEYTPGKGRLLQHHYVGSRRVATLNRDAVNFDLDRDGRADWSEIGQPKPTGVSSKSEKTYLNSDLIGSPVLATKQNGSVLWRQNYMPYGKQRVGIPNSTATNATRNQSFGGKSYDYLTGLSYFGARYYDPVIGRFMAVDPVAPDPERSVHTLNRYAYANNNPYKYVDPDGRMAFLAPMAWNVGRFVVTEIASAVVAEVVPVDIPLSKKGLLQRAVRDGARSLPGSVVKRADYSRPSGYRKGVRDKVWDNAKEASTGQVRDPVTGRFMGRDKAWDMGHKPGHEFKKHQRSAQKRGISRKQFLDEHNKPENYRPELPGSNRSHRGEDKTDSYFGP